MEFKQKSLDENSVEQNLMEHNKHDSRVDSVANNHQNCLPDTQQILQESENKKDETIFAYSIHQSEFDGMPSVNFKANNQDDLNSVNNCGVENKSDNPVSNTDFQNNSLMVDQQTSYKNKKVGKGSTTAENLKESVSSHDCSEECTQSYSPLNKSNDVNDKTMTISTNQESCVYQKAGNAKKEPILSDRGCNDNQIQIPLRRETDMLTSVCDNLDMNKKDKDQQEIILDNKCKNMIIDYDENISPQVQLLSGPLSGSENETSVTDYKEDQSAELLACSVNCTNDLEIKNTESKALQFSNKHDANPSFGQDKTNYVGSERQRQEHRIFDRNDTDKNAEDEIEVKRELKDGITRDLSLDSNSTGVLKPKILYKIQIPIENSTESESKMSVSDEADCKLQVLASKNDSDMCNKNIIFLETMGESMNSSEENLANNCFQEKKDEWTVSVNSNNPDSEMKTDSFQEQKNNKRNGSCEKTLDSQCQLLGSELQIYSESDVLNHSSIRDSQEKEHTENDLESQTFVKKHKDMMGFETTSQNHDDTKCHSEINTRNVENEAAKNLFDSGIQSRNSHANQLSSDDNIQKCWKSNILFEDCSHHEMQNKNVKSEEQRKRDCHFSKSLAELYNACDICSEHTENITIAPETTLGNVVDSIIEIHMNNKNKSDSNTESMKEDKASISKFHESISSQSVYEQASAVSNQIPQIVLEKEKRISFDVLNDVSEASLREGSKNHLSETKSSDGLNEMLERNYDKENAECLSSENAAENFFTILDSSEEESSQDSDIISSYEFELGILNGDKGLKSKLQEQETQATKMKEQSTGLLKNSLESVLQEEETLVDNIKEQYTGLSENLKSSLQEQEGINDLSVPRKKTVTDRVQKFDWLPRVEPISYNLTKTNKHVTAVLKKYILSKQMEMLRYEYSRQLHQHKDSPFSFSNANDYQFRTSHFNSGKKYEISSNEWQNGSMNRAVIREPEDLNPAIMIHYRPKPTANPNLLNMANGPFSMRPDSMPKHFTQSIATENSTHPRGLTLMEKNKQVKTTDMNKLSDKDIMKLEYAPEKESVGKPRIDLKAFHCLKTGIKSLVESKTKIRTKWKQDGIKTNLHPCIGPSALKESNIETRADQSELPSLSKGYKDLTEREKAELQSQKITCQFSDSVSKNTPDKSNMAKLLELIKTGGEIIIPSKDTTCAWKDFQQAEQKASVEESIAQEPSTATGEKHYANKQGNSDQHNNIHVLGDPQNVYIINVNNICEHDLKSHSKPNDSVNPAEQGSQIQHQTPIVPDITLNSRSSASMVQQKRNSKVPFKQDLSYITISDSESDSEESEKDNRQSAETICRGQEKFTSQVGETSVKQSLDCAINNMKDTADIVGLNSKMCQVNLENVLRQSLELPTKQDVKRDKLYIKFPNYIGGLKKKTSKSEPNSVRPSLTISKQKQYFGLKPNSDNNKTRLPYKNVRNAPPVIVEGLSQMSGIKDINKSLERPNSGNTKPDLQDRVQVVGNKDIIEIDDSDSDADEDRESQLLNIHSVASKVTASPTMDYSQTDSEAFQLTDGDSDKEKKSDKNLSESESEHDDNEEYEEINESSDFDDDFYDYEKEEIRKKRGKVCSATNSCYVVLSKLILTSDKGDTVTKSREETCSVKCRENFLKSFVKCTYS